MPDNKFIGNKIKALRTEKNITQEQLGELIGKTTSSIQKYERGVVEVPLSVLEKIANALDVSLLVLMDIDQLNALSEKSLSNGNINFAEFIHKIAESQFKKKYSPMDRICAFFSMLNGEGQEKAIERVEELTLIDKYLNDENKDKETE